MPQNDPDFDDAKTGASLTLNDLGKQASQAAGSVKDSLGSMAAEARAKLNETLDRQKTAGADQLSSLVQAVQTAAKELDEGSPQTAQLVRVAASSLDRFAGDLRSKDVPDLLTSLTTLARQQTAAVFAGSVLAGFVLARFLKSDNPVQRPTQRSPTPRPSSYRDWSADHGETTR